MEKDHKSPIATKFAVAAGLGIAGFLAYKLYQSKKKQQPDLPPFNWDVSVEEIERMTAQVLEEAQKNLDAVASVKDADLSYESVIRPLQLAPNYKTNPLLCNSKFLQHCHTDPSIRKAGQEAGTKFAAFKSGSRRRADVFATVQRYAETAEAKSLDTYRKHFLDAVIADFRRGGLGLSENDRVTLQQLLDDDAACCTKYSQNLGDDKTTVVVTVEELKGLPESFIQERLDQKTNMVTLTLKYPDIIPVMGQCEVAETRKKMTIAREVSAYGNNLDLVAEGIQLRKKTANLLGYKSWSAYVTETRMSGTPEVVTEFMGKIVELAKGGLSKDIEALRSAKVQHTGDATATLEAWDTSFYHNKILKENYGVDSEAIRQYFPLDHVVATTLEIYQEVLSLTFEELPSGSFTSWHPELRLFIVYDNTDNKNSKEQRVGHFYLDLHPRDGKYGHAAIFHLLKRSKGGQTAVDCMLCNLPAPTKDGPALLRHGDVVTFFHEFGHIMHGLLSEGEGNSTHLAKCPRDFVEAPSQMLENFCWQTNVLTRLSKHHVTGAPLPAPQISKLIGAKNVHEALGMMRQIYLASLDLAIHGDSPPADAAGLQALVNEMRPAISGINNPPNANMLRNFGHLMNQYSSAYYGYMWAEVISADMFATWFEKDCMSKEAGMAYRKGVLAPGGVGKIMDHLTKFLGHPPQQTPFLVSRGILEKK